MSAFPPPTTASRPSPNPQRRPRDPAWKAFSFEALSFPTFVLYCKKQGPRPSMSKRPQSDDHFGSPLVFDLCFSMVKIRARGHPRANGRRVTITFEALGQNWAPIFRPNVPKLREGCFKMSVSELCTGSSGSSGNASKRVEQTLGSPRRGAG